jgi:hypothetical protein
MRYSGITGVVYCDAVAAKEAADSINTLVTVWRRAIDLNERSMLRRKRLNLLILYMMYLTHSLLVVVQNSKHFLILK